MPHPHAIGVALLNELRHLPDNAIGLLTVQRPGLAVGAEYRNLHHDFLRLSILIIPNHKLDHTIAGFGLGNDVAQDLARVHILEYATIDAVDQLTLLQHPGRRGGRSLLHILDPHAEGRLQQLDTDPHRPEPIDRLKLRLVIRKRMEHGMHLVVGASLHAGQPALTCRPGSHNAHPGHHNGQGNNIDSGHASIHGVPSAVL